MVVTFMCQFDWLWSTQIKHCFWVCLRRVRLDGLDEFILWTGWFSKVDHPPQCGWVPSNQLRAWVKQKERQRKEEFCLFLASLLSWDISSHLFPPSSYWDLHHWILWFLGICGCTELLPVAFLGHLLADGRLRDLSASIIVWANSLFFSIYATSSASWENLEKWKWI